MRVRIPSLVPVTDRDIKELIKSISEMARRVGAVFVPDEKKIAAIRRGRVSTPGEANNG